MADDLKKEKVVTNVKTKRVESFAMDSFGSMKPTPQTMASLKQNMASRIGRK